jgi:glycosyltransferase involved in cell wall biosynthesis
MSDKLHRLKLIATGTGRCGTKFVSKLLTSAGLKCGHETFFNYNGLEWAKETLRNHWYGTEAESSWCAAPFLDDETLKDAFLVHLVRHPKTYIGSLLKIWPPGRAHTPYTEFAQSICPELREWNRDCVTWAALRWLRWNQMIESQIWKRQIETGSRRFWTFKIEDSPHALVTGLMLRKILTAEQIQQDLFDNRKANTQIKGPAYPVRLDDIDPGIREEMLELAKAYGYEWPIEQFRITIEKPVIKAIITTLDNQANNEEQLAVLRDEPLDEIIFVNNGSVDSTREWLDSQEGITAIHRENHGAGPGRNAGLDAAGQFDYVLMLDGGIRPLRGGTRKLLNYLQNHKEADVLGVEIADFETDYEKAWRRWDGEIENHTYQNQRLAHTAYALCRAKAWDGLRWCEDGPFGMPGWGADDDEMAYQWNEAGITIHVVTCACKLGKSCSGVHPYRRASGSFRRLEKETGIWPTDHGSVYSQRVVWLEQNWPQYEPGLQWGEPWLTIVVRGTKLGHTAQLIKIAHDEMRKRRFKEPWENYLNPYSIVLDVTDADSLTRKWAQKVHLNRHFGNKFRFNGSTVYRTRDNEKVWTGNFRIWDGMGDLVRPGAHYYGMIENLEQLGFVIGQYNELHPPQPVKKPPRVGVMRIG